NVDAEIEPGPGPCCERRCLVERWSLQVLRRVVDASERIELIVESHPHDAFSDVGIEVDRKRRQVCWQACGGRNVTEVTGKVFDFAGPIAAKANLGAGADRPAELCRMTGEASADRVDAGGGRGGADGAGVVIIIVIVVATVADAWGDAFRHDRGAGLRDALGETATRTADGAGGLDPADGKTPRGIDQRVRRGSRTKTRTQRSEPLQSLRQACAHWPNKSSGAGGGMAGRARAIERRCPPPLL